MAEHVETKRVVGSLEAAGDVDVERSLVGAINAHDVRLHQAASGPVMASGDVTITQGGCGPVVCSGDLSIRQGGCGPTIVRGNVTIEQGGTQSVIAGEAHLGSGSFVGLVAAPKVTIADGARVLMNTPQAAAFGAVLGLTIALFLRRRR
jgi:hypothetical protein